MLARRSRGPLLGLAFGGVVLGHVLAYALAHHDAVARHRHLALTGHGSFRVISFAAMVAGGLALTALGVHAVRSARTTGIGGLHLATVQLVIFTMMETAERGGSFGSALSDRAVRIGLVLQIVIGFLAAAITRLFERTLMAAARRPHRRPRQIVLAVLRPREPRLSPTPIALRALRGRAPPASLFAS